MNNECTHNIELINLVVDGQATNEESETLAKHILTCPECYERLIDYQVISTSMEDLRTKPPVDLHSNIMDALSREKIDFSSVKPTFRFSFFKHLPYAAAIVLLFLYFFNSIDIGLFSSSQDNGTYSLTNKSQIQADSLLENTNENSESAMLSRPLVEQSDDNDLAINSADVFSSSDIVDACLSAYPNSKFAFIILAKFKTQTHLSDTLNSSLLNNFSQEYFDNYELNCVIVDSSEETFAKLIEQLPAQGISAEILSDSNYQWYDENASRGLIILYLTDN